MRASLLAIGGLSMALAASLIGCSSSQSAPAAPQDAFGSIQPAYGGSNSIRDLTKGGLTPRRLLQLELEGKLPAPIPRKVLRYQLRHLGNAQPHSIFHGAAAKVALWTSDTNYSYLLGQSRRERKTAAAIDAAANGCNYPIALKVDHTQNLWVGCEFNSAFTESVVQEYASDGTLKTQYVPGCPNPVSECQSFSSLGYDSALDASGHVFAVLNLYSIEICNPSCVSSESAGFEWWQAGSPSATPTLISTGANCAPICGVGYADVDGSGNLWFTFSGYDSSGNYGFGLGEVSNPTTNPTLTIVEPIGTYQFFGGVYVSNGGKTLNVIDQNARTISQYSLPLSPSGKPFNVLGPTFTNAFGLGDPVSGGFNQTDTKLAMGDAFSWLDIGKVATNHWYGVGNPNFYSGLNGAAWTPSDK
ncbi:MAG TPA: hypothetical protein VGI19_15045 [Candidatus Cybelea sp.]|jgi:hypothetical protein